MSETVKGWVLTYEEDVEAHVDDSSEDENFTVTVRKGGQEVEKHKGLTAATVGDVQSEHFKVESVDIPTAPEPESDDDAPEDG